MRFDKIKYMHWAKQHIGTARYSLTCSNMLPVSLAELGIEREDIVMTSEDFYGYEPLKEIAAEKFNTGRENVFVGPGATGCNFVAMCAALDTAGGPAAHVLCENPGYTCLNDTIRAFEGPFDAFARRFEDGFRIDFDDLESKIRPDTKLLFVTNLSNPSGAPCPREDLERLATLSERHRFRVVVDEVYKDFVPESVLPDAFRLGDMMVSTTGFTKVYGLAGIRVGLLFADPEFVRKCYLIYDYIVAVNSIPGDYIATVALRQREVLIERARRLAEPALALVAKHIGEDELLDWVAPPAGIIAAPKILRDIDTMNLVSYLEEKYDTAISPGDLFGLPGHVRLGFGLSDLDDLDIALRNFRAAIREVPLKGN